MKKKKQTKPGIGWKAHLILFSVINVQMALDFFVNTDSILYKYHHIILAFDSKYMPILILNGICIILNVLCLLPLFLFVYRRRFLKPIVWKWLLLLRLLFEFGGHRYEILFIKSIFYSHIPLGIETTFITLAIILSSYWACYSYAFRQDKIIPKQQVMFDK